MPLFHRHYSPGHEQFITTGIYRRVQLFRSVRLARHFVDVLRQLRAELKFALVGWVLMPEHFHLLIRPEARSFARHSLPPRETTRHFFYWPWSSWRFYYRADAPVLAVDR